jgi:hypothetical protein
MRVVARAGLQRSVPRGEKSETSVLRRRVARTVIAAASRSRAVVLLPPGSGGGPRRREGPLPSSPWHGCTTPVQLLLRRVASAPLRRRARRIPCHSASSRAPAAARRAHRANCRRGSGPHPAPSDGSTIEPRTCAACSRKSLPSASSIFCRRASSSPSPAHAWARYAARSSGVSLPRHSKKMRSRDEALLMGLSLRAGDTLPRSA